MKTRQIRARCLPALAAVFSAAAALQAGTITNEMVVHLPFDNDYANLAPSTVAATPVNTVTFAAGRIGTGALQFSNNPTNSAFNYVTLGTPPELNFGGDVNLTVSLWVKFTRWKGDPPFIANKDWNSGNNVGWVLATAGDGRFQWNYTDGTGRRDYDGPGATINNGAWHHLAVSFDRQGSVVTFLDGVAVDTQPLGVAAPTLDSGLPTNIGQDGTGVYTDNGNVGIDDGMVDDVAIWRRALTAFEIQRIYQFGTNGVPVSAVPDPAGLVLSSTIPAANAVDVRADTAVAAVVVDGALPLDTGTVQFALNGTDVTIFAINKVGTQSTIAHQPAAPLPNGSTNIARLIYGDGVKLFTNTWSFVVVKGGQAQGITGHWDFDNADLGATVGLPLEYRDGPAGTTAAGTQFGSTRSFGLPGVQGGDARVMFMPGASTREIGYVMRHGALANGGPAATKVNQWTLIMDIFVPNTDLQPWLSFLQMDETNNVTDADLFARFSGGTGGIGIANVYEGNLTRAEWHRVAFAVDMSDPANGVISKFIDGVKVGDQSRGANQLDGRHALLPTALLFSDEDGESQPVFVNSIQVRNYKVSDAGMAALGAPTTDGIPLVSGQWDFEAGTVAATIGSPLVPRPDMEFYTTFETATVGSGSSGVMRFNYPAGSSEAASFGYFLPHGVLPNGGGAKANQYTLIMDLLFPAASTGWRALLQTETNNTTDADLFVNPGNGIGTSSQYQGNFTADTWHRVVFTVDLTKRELGKYIDGTNVLTGPVGSAPLGLGPYQYLSATDGTVDKRWSLDPLALLFGDEDGEVAAGVVSSIQTRPVILNPSQISDLGPATPGGIPVSFPPKPTLRIEKGQFGYYQISWPAVFTGYALDRSPTLGSDAVWTEVTRDSNPYEEADTPAPAFFYRLRKLP